MKYENNVKEICGDNWRETDSNERDGGYGVAMMIAFLNGARPNLDDFSRHLKVEISEIETAYRRLQSNGVFTPSYNAKNDPVLLGEHDIEPIEIRAAWAIVAGQASGFVGQGYYIKNKAQETLVAAAV
jgi:hypothetical protein